MKCNQLELFIHNYENNDAKDVKFVPSIHCTKYQKGRKNVNIFKSALGYLWQVLIFLGCRRSGSMEVENLSGRLQIGREGKGEEEVENKFMV